MSPEDLSHATCYPSAQQGREDAILCLETPQTLSPTYKLAYDDTDFLVRDDMRSVRPQLEMMKPEVELQTNNIHFTIVVFGSARAADPVQNPDGPLAKYYGEARKFATLASAASQSDKLRDYVVVTGGEPGIMEAANRGADDVHAKSIGLNITLPHEQHPNAYVTPELCFQFHYFAIRKMHFLMRARAMVAFPGGFGTMDELFKALTFIQTKKITPIPILLFGEDYWRKIVNFDAMVDAGVISAEDLDLFTYVETAEAAWNTIRDYYGWPDIY
jgi:uncharacterized protein (TIGR00730 family)